MNSKLFLKKVSYELGTFYVNPGVVISFLIKRKIRTNLDYDMLGIDN